MTYALDASAMLRFLEQEPGADRIETIFRDQLSGRAAVVASALHWGEVAGRAYRMRGRAAADMALQRLMGLGISIIPATADQAIRAALIRADHKIPYIDAFGVVLVSAPNHIFVTADFDLKPGAKLAKIEFLPAK